MPGLIDPLTLSLPLRGRELRVTPSYISPRRFPRTPPLFLACPFPEPLARKYPASQHSRARLE